jgi:hypothetical protein
MFIHHSEQSEESPTYPLSKGEEQGERDKDENFGGTRAKNSANILDRAGGRCGTLGFRKSRTVTSDLLANTDEILGKDLRNLDRRVGRVAYCHRRAKNQAFTK